MFVFEHGGDVIPGAGDRRFAYQDESSYPGCYIYATPSKRAPEEERKKYSHYEFFITKHTDSSMEVKLRKHRKDIIEQRKESGNAVMYEDYITTLSFGELMNRIFSGGCDVYPTEETYPESVRQAMRAAYP